MWPCPRSKVQGAKGPARKIPRFSLFQRGIGNHHNHNHNTSARPYPVSTYMDYSISLLSDIFLTYKLPVAVAVALPPPVLVALMGNSASHPNQGDDLDQFDGVETLGYRVLGVQPNSPASRAGLVSFFDFLVGANGKMLLGSGEELQDGEEYDDIDFPGLLKEHKDKTVELCKYSILFYIAREARLG